MLVAVVIVAFALLAAAGLVVAGVRAKRGSGTRGKGTRGSGSVASGVLGGFDLAFNPMGAEARDVLDVEQRHVAPAPSPDGDKGVGGIDQGRMTIDL